MQTFKPSSTMISAAKSLFMAKAYTATVRPVVEGYQRRILSECKFTADDDAGCFIKDPKRSYRMKNQDFKDYDAFCHAEAIKANFKVPEGYCPLLMAEDQERKAKLNLFEVMAVYLKDIVPGFSVEKIYSGAGMLENITKFEDLTLRLLAPYVKA